jgi:hypothetical protein
MRVSHCSFYIAADEQSTYIDVFGQELVGHAVFVDDIVVHARAGCGRACEETEESG